MAISDTDAPIPHGNSTTVESDIARHPERKKLECHWNERNEKTPAINSEARKTPAATETTTGISVPRGQQPAQAELLSERDIERLGRERPSAFKNAWTEIAFVFSISMSQVLAEYFISGFNVVLPSLVEELNIAESSAVWPASAFSLVVAATLLIFGRISDMIGGYPVYVFGMAWLFVWSVVAGFSRNRLMLIFCRMLQGIGPAAYLPSSMMLLAKVYRPGPRKNMVFSIYGTCAVVGFFIGIFCSGVSAQFFSWGWYFWIGAILAAITTVSSFLAIPSDMAETRKQGVKMDYMGAALIVPGLVLTVFAITDSAHAPDGWRTPYVYVCLIIGGILLGLAVYVEGWVAKSPLLPFDIFDAPYMKPLVASLLFFYGCLGVFLLYGTLYMVNIMGATPMQVVAWCVPMVVGGFVFPILCALFLHLISGTVLLIISGIGWVGTGVLFAVMPEGASYWAFAFPSMIGATLGIDITFNITNIFITTSQPAKRQGLAGAVINSVLHLSIAFLLGFADVAHVNTAHLGKLGSYRVVFWFQVGCAIVSLLIMILFVRVNAAKSEMTADERQQLMEMEQSDPQGSSANRENRSTSGLHIKMG
ncbi:drug resistance protein [Histoplasma capsulatum G186AR]|uniref:Drug resistance protein n=2 Tax=Ajellomyces capsulatus TaxID=5037 RepID=C0NPQ5_AJECG|nr:drug resistance protein [Histoplasma capsulatum G186AR]EEH06915.1 drug resistance protein [Histoplasma capsulatum G186AR]